MAVAKTSAQPILPIVRQHVDEAIMLRQRRSGVLRRPDLGLDALRRLDERLAAHLDGVAVAGEVGRTMALEQLAEGGAGSVFVAAVCALQSRNGAALTTLVDVAGQGVDEGRGWLSALGWVSAQDLQGTVRALLGSKLAAHKCWGLSACAMHQVDPGAVLAHAVNDGHAHVRARAWLVAGLLGRRDLADAARHALVMPQQPHDDQGAVLISVPLSERGVGNESGPQAECRAAAWALSLWGMGENDRVRQALTAPVAVKPALHALPPESAHRLATLAASVDWGRDQVRALAPQAEASVRHKRRMLRLAGWVGDVQVVPWLIGFMADDVWARLAGEAFSMITGADLALLDIERKPPEGIDFGPNDNPEDENVALDEDDSLPWPDQAKVQAWWRAQAARFMPGQRYFAGEPPSPAHCIRVLKTQGQRQRIMAAEYLCLLRPGSKLFPVAAPAWRQSRWLAEEEAALSAAGTRAAS